MKQHTTPSGETVTVERIQLWRIEPGMRVLRMMPKQDARPNQIGCEPVEVVSVDKAPVVAGGTRQHTTGITAANGGRVTSNTVSLWRVIEA